MLFSSFQSIHLLGNEKITENDPAILFAFDDDMCAEFVRLVNTGLQNPIPEPQPPFITSIPGQMTLTSLKEDLLNHLGAVAGGRRGNLLLNDWQQFTNVVTLLERITNGRFMQQVIRHLPENTALARLYILLDRSHNAMPLNVLAPPPPLRPLFH